MAFAPNTSLADQASVGGNYTKDGIFVRKGKIKSASISYNDKVNPKWSPSSVVLRLEVDQKDSKFTRNIDLYGDYKVAGGEISDEGSTFRVWELIKSIAHKYDVDAVYNEQGELVYNGDVVTGNVPFLVGKEIWFLVYAGYKKDDGKAGYRNFNRVFVQRVDQDDDDIERYIRGVFYTQVIDGWQKDYDPMLVDGGVWPDELKFLATGSANGNGKPAEAAAFDPDDDLPF